jgi:hypothetical protein
MIGECAVLAGELIRTSVFVPNVKSIDTAIEIVKRSIGKYIKSHVKLKL